MASFIFPTICRLGIISQNNVASNVAATKLFPTIDDNTTGLFIQAQSGNAQPVYVGSSAVAAAGANRGLPLNAGDDLGVSIAGPASSEFYQISTVGTDNILTMQLG